MPPAPSANYKTPTLTDVPSSSERTVNKAVEEDAEEDAVVEEDVVVTDKITVIKTTVIIPMMAHRPVLEHNSLLVIYRGIRTGRILRISSRGVVKSNVRKLPKVRMERRRDLVPCGFLMPRMPLMPLNR